MWLYNCLAFRAFLAGAPGRILDVGCGAGAYLAVWKSLGWTVEGVEPNERAAAVAAERLGATVHVGLVEDLQLEAGRYDLVTMCHSLEHVRSPRTVLRVVHRLLSQKGRLLLMMPNFAAWERSLLGEDWYGLEIPRHLYHFEPRTLINVLEKEGFVVRSLWGSAQPDGLIRSLRHRLGRHDADRAVGPVARVVGTAVLTLPAVLRRSGRMWAVAERAEDLAGPTI
ncbi:MAG: class I SAM-dependent methyltransferase [Thermoanaerobaculia bacterium]|nr:class I SAM-dependent methyltransferase [Thermoanaerobaculia bacterium]